MPACWPYYVNPYEGAENGYAGPGPEHSHQLKEDTPALYRAMCNPSTGNSGYSVSPADFFVLRSVSAEIPAGLLFFNQVNQASLTLSVNNAWYWFNDKWRMLTPEVGNANGLVQTPGTGVPPTSSVNIALRVQL